MAIVFSNNARTTLASNISNSATTITVADGSVFPSLTGGDIFYCTIDDGTNNEIVEVTAISSNTLTVVRGQDNTTARAFVTGDLIELRLVAKVLETFPQVETGEVTADEFIGDLRGAVIFKAQAGEAVSKGDAVYVSGISGNTPVIALADADFTSKMPAFGLVLTAASTNGSTEVVTFGTISGLDTSAFSVGDTLYVSTTAGELTNSKPTGEASLLQNIGKVQRSHASSGAIKVGGAGRTNDTPNLNDGNIFIGNASNQATTASLNTKIEDYLDANGITFPDNVKAQFGTGNDLEIFHTGSSSIIKDSGTGSLSVRGTHLNLADSGGNIFIEMTDTGVGGTVEIKHNAATKLTTSSSGIDVTGTVTSDSLAVVGSNSNIRYDVASSDPHTNRILHLQNQNATDGNVAALMLSADNANGIAGSAYIYAQSETTNQKGNLLFAREDGANTPVTSMKLSSNGDISFYDDTGTSQALYWDASTERLAIGNTSPTSALDVTGTATMDGLTVDGGGTFRLNSGSTNDFFTIQQTSTHVNLIADSSDSAGNMFIKTANSSAVDLNRIRIQHTGDISFYDDTGTSVEFFWDASAESLGIGTTSPYSSSKLHIQGTDGASGASTNVGANELFIDNNGNTGVTVGTSNTGTGYYAFADSDVALRGGLFYDHSTDDMGFRVASATAMTIDSSGNATFSGTIDSGDINIGTADTTNGTLTIHGGGTGNAEGGEIRLGLAADHDTTYDFYRIDTLNDDLRIGRQGQTDFYIFQDGLVKVENNFEVGGTISSGAITSTGASSGRYTGLEVVNTTNAGGTETAIGLGVVSAGNNACDVKLVANRVGANSGSDFYIEQTDASGNQDETFRITEDGNATFAGTISSGAITSTGTSEFASLNLGGVTSTASSFLSGTQRIVSDGYIATQAIYNYSETGSAPAAIVFGDGATYGNDQISLITGGNTAVYINSSSQTTFGYQANFNSWVYIDVAGTNLVMQSDTSARETIEWKQGTTRLWTLDLKSGGHLDFVSSNADDELRYNGSEVLASGANISVGTINSGAIISTGEVEATALDINGNGDISGNLTLGGYLAGPATFTIDPAAVGDNTGTVVIAGNLQVDGTTTTVNSTTVNVSDKAITLGYDATTDAANNLAGIVVYRPETSNAQFLWSETNERFEINRKLNISQQFTVDASGTNDTMIEIGAGTASNHYAYIDLIGDATYTDYGLRIIRNNSGANTSSVIYHRGTGNFDIETQEAAAIRLRTGGLTALALDSSQNANFTGDVTANGYLQHYGFLYSRNNLRVLNAAGTGWNDWATRSNGTFNLDVGTISSGGITASGTHTFTANDVDFIVQDTTDSITNYIWRDYSTSKLYLGTANAVVTLRSTLDLNSNNITNAGTISSGDITITSSGTIGGSTLANAYLTLTDGSVTMGFDANEIHTTDDLYLLAEAGNIIFRDTSNAGVILKNGSTQFMDTSLNLSNIGTISSGAITSTGNVTAPGVILDGTGQASYDAELKHITRGNGQAQDSAVDSTQDIYLAYHPSSYVDLAATQTYSSATEVSQTFTIGETSGSRWYAKVKMYDPQTANDPVVCVNDRTEHQLRYENAVNGSATDDSNVWTVVDITDDVVDGSNTIKVYLKAGQKAYFVALYVFSSGGLHLPNEPYELPVYSDQGFGVEDQLIITKARNIQNIQNITLTGTVDGRDLASDGSKLDGIAAGATNTAAPFYTSAITSSDVTTALGYTPYQEDTGLSATTGIFSSNVNIDRTLYLDARYDGGSGDDVLAFKDSLGNYSIRQNVNDGNGNYSISIGYSGAGSGQYAVTNDGVGKILFGGHGRDGAISLNAAPTGTAGNNISFSIGLLVDGSDNTIRVGASANGTGMDTAAGTKVFDASANAFATSYSVGANEVISSTRVGTFPSINLDDQIISTGDTNTYMQFHAADQWRVVTGGSERIEANNTRTAINNGYLQITGSDSHLVPTTTATASTVRLGKTASTRSAIVFDTSSTGTTGTARIYTVENAAGDRLRIGNPDHPEALAINNGGSVSSSGDFVSDGLTIGSWTIGSNTGQGRIGKASDRPTGAITNQIGNSGGYWEIVDYAWSVVAAQCNNSGDFTVYRDFNTSSGGYEVNSTTVIDSSRRLTNIAKITGNSASGGTTTFNVGRGDVYFESNSNSNANGAGITLRTSGNPTTGSIFEVRSSGQACRLFSGQNLSSAGTNPFYVGTPATGNEHDGTDYEILLNTNGDITAEGNITAYGTVSDIRQKENIEQIDKPIERLEKIKGITFNYKKKSEDERLMGVIAQDLLEDDILKLAVYEQEDFKAQDDDPLKNTYGVRYEHLTAILIEAVKDQQKQIESLKSEINNLKGEK